MRSFIKQVVKRGFHRVIGTSGTILALGPLAMGARRQPNEVRNLRVDARDFRRLRKRLTELSLNERLKLPGLDPRRADLSVAGAVLIDELLNELGADDLSLCDFALREGLVLDYVQRNRKHIHTVERYPDVRRRSVVELGERCSYYPEHAKQVSKLALALFDATKADHKLAIASGSGSSTPRSCTTSARTSATSATTSTRTTSSPTAGCAGSNPTRLPSSRSSPGTTGRARRRSLTRISGSSTGGDDGWSGCWRPCSGWPRASTAAMPRSSMACKSAKIAPISSSRSPRRATRNWNSGRPNGTPGRSAPKSIVRYALN